MNKIWDAVWELICIFTYILSRVALVGIIGTVFYCFVKLFRYGGGGG